MVPRIPGVDEYLAALDERVETALRRRASAARCAGRSGRSNGTRSPIARGRDAQRQAYLKHLGIDEP